MSVNPKEDTVAGGEQWVPVLQVFPKYPSLYSLVKSIDKHGTKLMNDQLGLQPQDALVFMKTIPLSPITSTDTATVPLSGHIFPLAMAWPFTITKETTDGNGILAHGALLTLVDMFTSLHLMVARLPQFVGHVSVSLQCNTVQSMREGESIVAVTRVDKMGKRLLFSSVEFLSSNALTGLEDNDRMNVIQTAIQDHKVCANAKHVKSLLPPSTDAKVI
ncbi:Thioesterase domain [Trypanosoma melophagium]|uniref:Thioesterase domain n=1 Tax=Trypanosoma melophagium TaxID=715481 RepID=UPI003519DA93|nr:Thioesterase domain [Trypanosoma melophagium]